MGKPKPTPKLDATVKAVANQQAIPVPEYTRPYQEFQRTTKIGMRVSIKKRSMNAAHGRYDLVEIEGVVSDLNSNMVMINTGSGFKTSPWWAIHDWEIMGELEVEI